MSEFYEETDIVRRRRGSVWPWFLLVLTLGASGFVIYWLRGQLELAASRVKQTELGLERRQREIVNVTAECDAIKTRVDELEIRDSELTRDNERLTSDVKAKADELAKLKSTYVDMESKLKTEIKNGEIRLTQIGEKLQVELVDKILFDSGDATISKRGEEVLMRVGQVLGKIEDRQIQVSGHTDAAKISEKLAAQYPTNWELSVARATNVVRFLGEKAGVPEQLLIASGHGPYKPVASNSTPAGRARNRRIEILLTPLVKPVKTKLASSAR